MKITIPVILLLFTGFIVACGGGENGHQGEHQHNDHSQHNIQQPSAGLEAATHDSPEEFRQQLDLAVTSYLTLKDVLVTSDAAAAGSHAEDFHASLKNISSDGLSGEARTIWTDNLDIMLENSEHIAGLDDIEEQRAAFEPLSHSLISTVETFGPLNRTLYQQTCPMVGDGSADWLSESENILNPYHGDRMLRCGSVVRRF